MPVTRRLALTYGMPHRHTLSADSTDRVKCACASVPAEKRGEWHHNREERERERAMSSKSLTAVTSFVSVIRERTVFVLRLNVRGCQRVAAPIAIIVCYLLALALFTAAGATDDMVKVGLAIVCYSLGSILFFSISSPTQCMTILQEDETAYAVNGSRRCTQ